MMTRIGSVLVLGVVVLAGCGSVSGDAVDAAMTADTPNHVDIDAAPDAAPPPLGAMAQRNYIKASNTGTNDNFGGAIALSADGNTLAIASAAESSASTEADNSAPGAGAVYIFARTGTTWTQQAYVKASNPATQDTFGTSVALSADGSTLAVSAIGEDSAAVGINGNQASNAALGSGAVYVFTRTGTTWAQQAYVKASNTEANDAFGTSVALSSDGATLAVGANGEDSQGFGNQADNTFSNAGAAYVYVRNATTWNQQAYIKASNPGSGDSFGGAVALSGDGSTLAVGSYFESSGSVGVNGTQNETAAVSGAVYVVTRVGSTWSQQAFVKASNTGSGDLFGATVALSADGTTLAVGAFGEESAATGINGNQADNAASQAGAVYAFTRVGPTWSQQAYIKASNTNASDFFGRSCLALSGNGSILIVGAFFEDSADVGINGNQADNSASEAGAAYVFMRAGTTWSQSNYVKASNTAAADRLSIGGAVSADGATVALGAPLEDSAAIGIDGNQADNAASESGAVYLYR